MKVKIRGIYTTALSRLLKKKEIEIVQPSELITKRFNVKNNNESATTLIYDKKDSNGVIVSGKDAEKIVDILKERFEDIVIKRLERGAVYAGKIKEIKAENIIVDLGNEEKGVLSLQSYTGSLKEKEKVLVQVKAIVRGRKILSSKLRIFGENAILIKDGFTKVSKHIKHSEEKERLLEISNNIVKNGWGVLWKALAEGKSDEELEQEIKEMYEEEKEIKEKYENAKNPQLIEDGMNVFFVDFGALSKKELDKIRGQVLNTIPGHHFLKAGEQHILVDFAESLKNIDHDLISRKIEKVLKKNGPRPGSFHKIIHKKAGNRDVYLSGIIKEVNKEKITMKRKLKPGGRLDGIGEKINKGDYAITTFEPNKWVVEHRYFDKEDNPKGVYYNVNTPIEIYPEFSRYIDLEIDVVKKNGEKKIIDKEKLEKIKNKNIIKNDLAEKAVKIANKLSKE